MLYLVHTNTGSGFLSGHSAALGVFLFDCPVACRLRIGCAVSKVLSRAEKVCISLCVVSILLTRGDVVLSVVKLFVDIDLERGSQRHARKARSRVRETRERRQTDFGRSRLQAGSEQRTEACSCCISPRSGEPLLGICSFCRRCSSPFQAQPAP